MRYPYFAEQVTVRPMFDNEKLYGGLFIDAGMAAIFSDRATVQAMLDFEVSLGAGAGGMWRDPRRIGCRHHQGL